MKYSGPHSRTFEASKHAKGTPERDRLNNQVLTSEYMPSYKFVVCEYRNCVVQPVIEHSFKSKAEAQAFMDSKHIF